MLARRLADMTEGDCERSGVPSNSWRAGDMPLRVDQKSCGEGLEGDVGEGEAFSFKGEGSSPGSAFWSRRQQMLGGENISIHLPLCSGCSWASSVWSSRS